MNNSIKFSLLSLILSFSFISISQERDVNSQAKNQNSSNYYTLLSFGVTNPLYRDFATSPLFYSGIGFELNASWLKESEERSRIFEIGLGLSAQMPNVPQSKLISAGGLAGFGKFNFVYQELWKLKDISDAKNNFKIGGALKLTQNVRGNPALQNNAMGLENISNLMASAQWTRDISRNQDKQINLWLFKPTLKAAQRELKFLLNVGVLNFNYRPGYAYAYDSELNAMETSPVEWAFANYKWSLNGWRLKTQLEYVKYMSNGNARSLSYVWEAAHAPGKFEDFQMASHQLRYTIYFNTKTK
ncbi:hypothetical protein [Brumimicrobium oceani]|uniref:DUF2490 domain-containing protein n=1 Tax=Brumimicrobium oceani TaxID=2100725 RepID=A0A2U2X392_9FLAO|nr:hypothetical protein [Brumimicrobium oceani]PWH82255.1 hypothetical protein DIT68_14215 [Brumimicrobium oceani]